MASASAPTKACKHKERTEHPAYRIYLDQIKWADFVAELKYSYLTNIGDGKWKQKENKGTCWFVGWESNEESNDTFFLMTCEHVVKKWVADNTKSISCSVSFVDFNKRGKESIKLDILDNITNDYLDYALLKVKLIDSQHRSKITIPKGSGLGKWVSKYEPISNENLIMFGFPKEGNCHKIIDFCEITNVDCLQYCILNLRPIVYKVCVENRKDRIFYQCNSSYGASGSPCFSQNGVLVAMHAGGDVNPHFCYERGVDLSMCIKDIQRQLQNNDAMSSVQQKISKDTLQRLFPQMKIDGVQTAEGDDTHSEDSVDTLLETDADGIDQLSRSEINSRLELNCLKMLVNMTKLIGTVVHNDSPSSNMSTNMFWVIWLNKPPGEPYGELYIVCAGGKNWKEGKELRISFDNEYQNALAKEGGNWIRIKCSGENWIHCTDYNMSLLKKSLITEDEQSFVEHFDELTLGYNLQNYTAGLTLRRVAFLLSGVPHPKNPEEISTKCIDFCHVEDCFDHNKKSMHTKPDWWNEKWAEIDCEDYADGMNIVGSPCILPDYDNYREIMGICYKKGKKTISVVNLYTFISKIEDNIKKLWGDDVFDSLVEALNSKTQKT